MNTGNPKQALTKSQSELLAYLFESRQSLLSTQMTAWLTRTPRYEKFISKFKDKIRKKLRLAHGSTAEADLLHELHVAYWLLQEPRFEVAYEPYASGKTRGPDFSVTFRTNFRFNIEVTHIRKMVATQVGETHVDFRLVDVISGKLHQMRANMANLLLVVSSTEILYTLDLTAHFSWMKRKAEQKDGEFFARHGFADPSDFFKYFERLSGVGLCSAETNSLSLWTNPQARVKLPDAVKNILLRASA